MSIDIINISGIIGSGRKGIDFRRKSRVLTLLRFMGVEFTIIRCIIRLGAGVDSKLRVRRLSWDVCHPAPIIFSMGDGLKNLMVKSTAIYADVISSFIFFQFSKRRNI